MWYRSLKLYHWIVIGFLIFGLVLTGMMGTYLNYFTGVMHELTPLK